LLELEIWLVDVVTISLIMGLAVRLEYEMVLSDV